jgi:hypothetical protein
MSPGEDVRDYYRKQGIMSERERIIKILLTNQCEDENHSGECRTFISNVYQYIALIKGDK